MKQVQHTEKQLIAGTHYEKHHLHGTKTFCQSINGSKVLDLCSKGTRFKSSSLPMGRDWTFQETSTLLPSWKIIGDSQGEGLSEAELFKGKYEVGSISSRAGGNEAALKPLKGSETRPKGAAAIEPSLRLNWNFERGGESGWCRGWIVSGRTQISTPSSKQKLMCKMSQSRNK